MESAPAALLDSRAALPHLHQRVLTPNTDHRQVPSRSRYALHQVPVAARHESLQPAYPDRELPSRAQRAPAFSSLSPRPEWRLRALCTLSPRLLSEADASTGPNPARSARP